LPPKTFDPSVPSADKIDILPPARTRTVTRRFVLDHPIQLQPGPRQTPLHVSVITKTATGLVAPDLCVALSARWRSGELSTTVTGRLPSAGPLPFHVVICGYRRKPGSSRYYQRDVSRISTGATPLLHPVDKRGEVELILLGARVFGWRLPGSFRQAVARPLFWPPTRVGAALRGCGPRPGRRVTSS